LSPRHTDRLLNEYTAYAPTYDNRWAAYLDASLQMTMDAVGDLPGASVLDVACGTGLLLEKLAGRPDNPELAGIDRVPAMLDVAKQRLGPGAVLLEASAEKLPFDDASFELVVSSNALHYFSDAASALREMRRVVSTPGNLVLTDWCRDFVSMKLLNRVLPWTRLAHTHAFSSVELERRLARAGFRVVSTKRRKIDWFWGLMTVHAVAT